MAAKRSYGTGSLYVRTDAAGVEHFLRRVAGERPADAPRARGKRPRGSREGLTQIQAEEKLRRLMAEKAPATALGDRLTLSEAGCATRGILPRESSSARP